MVKQNNIRQKFKNILQSFKDNLKELFTNNIVNIIAGIPESAQMTKNSPKPYESTMNPDELEINLDGKVPNKNKPAYWVAVYVLETTLERREITTTTTNPWVKLSAVIVKTRKLKSLPTLFSNKKNRLVTGAKIEPATSILAIPNLWINKPPNKPPAIVMERP